MDVTILFFTSPYSLFVFQLTLTNETWLFFLYLLFITLYCFFFFTISLSLSLFIGNLSFSKIWWWFYDIKYASLVSLCYIWFDILIYLFF